nr:MAG TPA: hypothetical protein [Caudoviricetes sp.]
MTYYLHKYISKNTNVVLTISKFTNIIIIGWFNNLRKL